MRPSLPRTRTVVIAVAAAGAVAAACPAVPAGAAQKPAPKAPHKPARKAVQKPALKAPHKPAHKAPHKPAHRTALKNGKCLELAFKEVSHLTPHDLGEPGLSVGDTVDYNDELYTADGAKAGTAKGHGVHFWVPFSWKQYHRGGTTFTDGSVAWTGVADVDGSLRGEFQKFLVWGTSGRYRGLTGTWSFRFADRTDPRNPVFESKFDLCR